LNEKVKIHGRSAFIHLKWSADRGIENQQIIISNYLELYKIDEYTDPLGFNQEDYYLGKENLVC